MKPNSTEIMAAVVALLNQHPGVTAYLEYPGWINLHHDGKEWAFGDSNGPWEGYQTKDSEPVDDTWVTLPVPDDCTDPQRIAEPMLAAIRQHPDDAKLAAYVRGGGHGCPFCGPDTISIEGGPVTIECPQAFQECSCTECGRSWKLTYNLALATAL